jgi:hypothetical protein
MHQHANVVFVVDPTSGGVLGDTQECYELSKQVEFSGTYVGVKNEIILKTVPSISFSRNGVPLVMSSSRMMSASMYPFFSASITFINARECDSNGEQLKSKLCC